MDRLLNGYRSFRAQRWPKERALYGALAEQGQSPRMLIIACSDSRVDPSAIFDAGPGELFVVRNVANLVPPYEQGEGLHGTSAAIEFAVRKLRVRTILVLGHAQCGGVAAALAETPDPDDEFIAPWIALLNPARDRCAGHSGDEAQAALEKESIRVSVERLMTFPFVKDAVARGELALEGAHFGISDGHLELLDRQHGVFVPLA
ncbi:MAG: carbonic anhydrase [Alphaproteobacteria bacterium]|nr:carbonic anhydrase [Alphaproteobacteria bacterium]